MSKVVYTENVLDQETGEITPKRWITRKVENTDMFVRAYINDITKLAKCNKSEQSFILCSLKYLEYNTNELILNPSRRTEIAECAGLKMNTLHIAVSNLYKKNILIKVNQRTYLNPKLFFFGTDLERTNCYDLTIRYEIEDTSIPQSFIVNKPSLLKD